MEHYKSKLESWCYALICWLLIGFSGQAAQGVKATPWTTTTNVPTAVTALLGSSVDSDANDYMTTVGSTLTPTAQARIYGGFRQMKVTGLWTNLVDGAVFGTNMNLSGSAWLTFKGRTGTSVNSPTVLDYGMAFNGSSQYAYLHGLPDTRTNTLIVIFENSSSVVVGQDGAIISLQNNASINGTEGVWTDGGCSACGIGVGIFSYLRNVFPATYTNGIFPYVSAHPTSGDARMISTDPQEHTLAIATDNQGLFTHFTDGYSVGATNFGYGFASPLTSINIAVAGLADGVPFSSSYYKGTVKSWMLLSGPPSTNQVRDAMTALRWFDMREENNIFVGDSMTTPLQDFRTNQNWPYQMMTLTSRSNAVFYRNVAINGTAAVQWPAWYSTYVQQFKPGGPVKKSTIFYRLGPNDILSWGEDAPTTFYQMSNFWYLAKLDKFNIATFTLTPATNYTWAPGKEAIRLALNTLIASNGPTYVDKVYRLDQVWTDPGPSTWWTYDSLHQNAAGYLAIAQMVANDSCVPNTPYGGGIADQLATQPMLLTNRLAIYQAHQWDVDTGSTFLNPSAPSPSPYFISGGTSGSGSASQFINITLPQWVTNVSGSILIQSSTAAVNSQAWTNTATTAYFSMDPATGRTVTTAQALPIFCTNGLNILTWTNLAIPFTNTAKYFQLQLSPSTNSTTRYYIAPLTLIFN